MSMTWGHQDAGVMPRSSASSMTRCQSPMSVRGNLLRRWLTIQSQPTMWPQICEIVSGSHDCVMRSSAATKGMPRSSHWIMPLTVRVEIMTPSSDWSAFRRISWMTSCRFSGLRWSSGRCQERGSAGGGGGGGGAGIGLIRLLATVPSTDTWSTTSPVAARC